MYKSSGLGLQDSSICPSSLHTVKTQHSGCVGQEGAISGFTHIGQTIDFFHLFEGSVDGWQYDKLVKSSEHSFSAGDYVAKGSPNYYT